MDESTRPATEQQINLIREANNGELISNLSRPLKDCESAELFRSKWKSCPGGFILGLFAAAKRGRGDGGGGAKIHTQVDYENSRPLV